MPALRSLNLSKNRLTELPDDLGQRLPQLTEIDLSRSRFRAVPLAALLRATSLEKIELGFRGLQPGEEIEGQLESLVRGLPCLQELRLKYSWELGLRTPDAEARAREEQLVERLRERNRNVRIVGWSYDW